MCAGVVTNGHKWSQCSHKVVTTAGSDNMLRTHSGSLDGRPRQKARDERRGWPPVPARPPQSRRRSCSGPSNRTVSTRRPAPTKRLRTHNGPLDGRPRHKVRGEQRGWPPDPRPPRLVSAHWRLDSRAIYGFVTAGGRRPAGRMSSVTGGHKSTPRLVSAHWRLGSRAICGVGPLALGFPCHLRICDRR